MPEPQDWREEDEELSGGRSRKAQAGLQLGAGLALIALLIPPLLMVLASTVGMCLNTFEWIQKKDVNGDPVDNPYLSLIEAVCISYFSVEFLLR